MCKVFAYVQDLLYHCPMAINDDQNSGIDRHWDQYTILIGIDWHCSALGNDQGSLAYSFLWTVLYIGINNYPSELRFSM